jgi:ubiquinone/menaquinone biosynthesis C-methylase UbiE
MSDSGAALSHIAQSYDDTPYMSHAFFYCAPGHLRAAAHLYGVDTEPLEKARVLELGCSAGGNLLPFAMAYPQSHCVGVDLSTVQVARGQEVARDLGVANLTLRAMSLTDITSDFGQFDYIIVHGVYSWVPPEVQQAILRVCRENLASRGLACISYNTYPGWKIGDIVRDAMLLHGEGAQDAGERIARGKAMLEALHQGMSDSPLAGALRGAIEKVRRHSDYYLAHEYFEDYNLPCYFMRFAQDAAGAGLGYVGDAEPHTELPVSYGGPVRQGQGVLALREPKVLRQQYLDFAVARNFRKSLLTRADRIDAGLLSLPDQERLRELRVAGNFSAAPRDDKAPTNARAYQNQRGRKLHTSEAHVEAVMQALTQAWPGSLSWDELCERTRGKFAVNGDAPTGHADEVSKGLSVLFRLGLLYLSREPGPYDDTSERAFSGHPQLIPGYAYLSRRNAAQQGFGVGSFNLWHDIAGAVLSPNDRAMLPLLDGWLDRPGVIGQAAAMIAKAAQARQAQPSTPKIDPQAEAEKFIDRLLGRLHAQGVLRAQGKR